MSVYLFRDVLHKTIGFETTFGKVPSKTYFWQNVDPKSVIVEERKAAGGHLVTEEGLFNFDKCHFWGTETKAAGGHLAAEEGLFNFKIYRNIQAYTTQQKYYIN